MPLFYIFVSDIFLTELMKMNIFIIVCGLILVTLGCYRIFNTSHSSPSGTANDVESYDFINNANPVEKHSDLKAIGNDFEGYVADILKSSGLKIKEWNQGSTSPGGAYGENELKPDFLISHNFGKFDVVYWVECKFRSYIPSKGFELKKYQVDRYKSIQAESKRKVVIALGVGGEASNPSEFYLVPLDSLIRYKHIPAKYLIDYKLENPTSSFAKHIKDWFKIDVFSH